VRASNFLLLCALALVFLLFVSAASKSQIPRINTSIVDDDDLTVNYALTPDNWGDGPYNVTGTLLYGVGPQIWSMDADVLYNGAATMKCVTNAGTTNDWRELDLWNWTLGYNQPFSVSPGDHIVLGVWVKQSSSTKGVGDGTRQAGNACIWFDVWVDAEGGGFRFVHTVCGSNSWAHPEAPDSYDLGNFGIIGGDWTYVNVDVVIPDTVTDVWNGGGSVVPQYISPIISGGWLFTSAGGSEYVQEQATAWFANANLYINPASDITFTFDGWLQKTRVETLTFDGYPKLEQVKTLTVDANLTNRYLKTVTLDAWLQGELPKTFTLDGIPWTSGAFNFNADLLSTYAKTFTVDGWLQKSVPGTFTYDTVLQGRKGVFSFDGFLQWWTATVSRLGFVEAVIAEMQNQNIGDYCFEAGCVEPGVDNVATPIRRAAAQMREA
jgi:hypothetical protein